MKRFVLMINTLVLLAPVSVAGLSLPAAVQAADAPEAAATESERTVTFAVDKMTCAACPITVRQAMQKVEGVKSVTVDFEARTATVVFNPTVTTPDQIGAASADAGYPATPTS